VEEGLAMPSERQVILTPQGKEDLERELEVLRTVKLPEVTSQIHEMTNEGDVSDNSEYEDTKEQLVIIEARIREVQNMLRHAQVIANDRSRDVVQFGSSVTLTDGDGISETWTIVSPEEANTLHGKISTESPVGAALMGKRPGENVIVRAPGGETTFTIQKVE
jgi:transcription elongation factor GreA